MSRRRINRWWLLPLLLALLSFILPIVFHRSGYPDFFRALAIPQFLGHPITTLGALFLLGLSLAQLSAAFRPFDSVIAHIGNALSVAAVVGLLVEVPHIRAVFEEGLVRVLTSPDYVRGLNAGRRDQLLLNLIGNDLGDGDLAHNASKVFAGVLNRRLTSGIYVDDDFHEFNYTWRTPWSNEQLSGTQIRTRVVNIPRSDVEMEFGGLLLADMTYQVLVNDQICLEHIDVKDVLDGALRPAPITSGPASTPKCNVRISKISDRSADLVGVIRFAQPGSYRVTEKMTAFFPTSHTDVVTIEHPTKQLRLKYLHPSGTAAQLVLKGDFAEQQAAVRPSWQSRINQFELEHAFRNEAGFDTNSVIFVVLTEQR